VRYANAAEAPARRAAVSLTRMQPLGDARALLSLGSAWTQAEALYGSIAALTRSRRALPALGQQIEVRQAQLAALAQTDRLPACGPAGR
jgi:hypothetical protein